MAVPDTNTFSLQDVVDEIPSAQSSLVDCFSDAISTSFDPSYSGSKDRLSNFRNYDHVIIYYNLISCSGGLSVWTILLPPVSLQRYQDTVSFIFYRYNNVSSTTLQTVNNDLLLIIGQTGCP